MCPIETPEGPNIGLIGGLASFARVNAFGFIESPYRRGSRRCRQHDIIRYLAADEEEEYVVAQANAELNPDGTFATDKVLVRRSPQAATLEGLRLQLEQDVFFGATTEISYVPGKEVQMMDVSPKQIISIATALIPFLEHDDANRALMGANMQRQAVPLLRAEAPYIGTGVEARAANDAANMILALDDGAVAEVNGNSIVVDYAELGRHTHVLASSTVRTRTPASTRRPGSCSATKSRRASSSATAHPLTGVNSLLARTCWWRSCHGEATTLKMRSS